jgi:hypothetical protein
MGHKNILFLSKYLCTNIKYKDVHNWFSNFSNFKICFQTMGSYAPMTELDFCWQGLVFRVHIKIMDKCLWRSSSKHFLEQCINIDMVFKNTTSTHTTKLYLVDIDMVFKLWWTELSTVIFVTLYVYKTCFKITWVLFIVGAFARVDLSRRAHEVTDRGRFDITWDGTIAWVCSSQASLCRDMFLKHLLILSTKPSSSSNNIKLLVIIAITVYW